MTVNPYEQGFTRGFRAGRSDRRAFIRPCKVGWAVDTYDGRGQWQSTDHYAERHEAQKALVRARKQLEK